MDEASRTDREGQDRLPARRTQTTLPRAARPPRRRRSVRSAPRGDYLPNIGLFYGLQDWFGVSARTLAFVDTTISAPLGQLTMVPVLVLIARTAPAGAEATMFAIMASLMNLALSASELFTRWLNDAFAVTQQDYSRLGQLMIAVLAIGLLPLLALPVLRRNEGALPGERRV